MHINGINQLNSTTQCKDFHNVKVNTIIWVYGGHSPIHMGWYYVTHINPWWIGEELIFPVVLETEGKLCWALKLAISTQRPGPPKNTTQHHDVSFQSTLDRRPMYYSEKMDTLSPIAILTMWTHTSLETNIKFKI